MKAQENNGSQEPSMFLQRPSASTSQDVRHILTHSFRDIYTRDAIRQDTVKNLQVSKHGSDSYHERYVDSLQSVHEEWQRRMDEAAMLERHIMQAQARAMSADERELNRVSSSCDDYQQLRLPPGYSHFRSCLDTNLLQSHTLLTPDHYLTEEPSYAPPPRHEPQAPSVPQYARDTVASQQHSRAQLGGTDPGAEAGAMSGLGADDFTCITSEDWGSDTGKTSASQEVKKPPPQAAWKSKMTRMDMEMEKQALEKMKNRMNYLLNRRHQSPSEMLGPSSLLHYRKLPPKPYNLPSPLPDPEPAPSVIFLASPKVIFFQDYTVNEVYEQYITLKNVSTVLRPVRVLPPSTKFFSLGLGQFPCDSGLVAPGMTCRFSVRFSPDSFKDYEDEVVIETQSAKARLTITLLAQRERPVLTLPKTLDVGQCLVGGYSITQFIIKNVGGPARFCILPRQAWPATNLKSVVKNGAASIPPFDVRPSLFDLVPGQAGVVEVAFSPPRKGAFTEELTILCDNCHLQHVQVTGIGDVAKVEVVSVEHGETLPLPGETNDAYAQHFIRFDDLNPYTYTERTVIIKNCSLVDQPFQWRVCRPILLPLDHFQEDGQAAKGEAGAVVKRQNDDDSVFSIHPPSGVLPGDSTLDFKITFAPPRLQDYHSVLQLLLLQVPQESCTGSPPLSFQRHPISPKVSVDIERSASRPLQQEVANTPTSAAASTRDIMVNGSSTRVQNMEEDSSDDYRTGDPCHDFKAPILRDIVGVEIELKGSAVPVDLVFHPYIVSYPGNITLGLATKRTFSMANHSFTTVTFQWEPFLESHIIEVEPPFGELDPGMVMDFELSLTGVKPGRIEHRLKCHILNVEEPFSLRIEANVKGPEVIVEESSVDFGLLRVHKTSHKTITLFNKSHLPAKWSITDRSVRPPRPPDEVSLMTNPSAVVACINKDGRLTSILGPVEWPVREEDETLSLLGSDFTFSPEGGELRPLERKEVVISILPTDVKRLHCVLQLNVEDGETSYISVYGEVQSPLVCLLKCELEVSVIYVGVVSETVTTLFNRTAIPTSFRWLEAEGEDASRCEVTVSPKEGVLQGRQTLPITVSLLTNVMECITDLRIPCHVVGMEEPVVLSVNCDVNGLEVKLAVLDENLIDITKRDEQHLIMDFGENHRVGDEPWRFLQIQNLSGIAAPFHLHFENYGPPRDFPTAELRGFKKEKPAETPEGQVRLKRTKHIGDPTCKTSAQERKELLQQLLSRDLGLALVPSFSQGVLEPFGNQIIEVAAFFSMWGQYSDRLVFKIGKRTEMDTNIAVKVGAVGCPLQFQMVANQPHQQQAIVRFGTQVCGTDPVTRIMKVKNKGPCDIRLDWREYNRVPGDLKLLDLVLSYCRPFPPLDAQGKEVLPLKDPSLMEMGGERLESTPPPASAPTATASTKEEAEEQLPSSQEVAQTASTASSSSSTGSSSSALEDRPKIISLFLRSHDGQESTSPYKVEPTQQVIPAHGHSTLTVTFKPLCEKDAPEDLKCDAFALGYTSLDSHGLLNTPGKVYRPEAYHAVPLRLEMTARLKLAKLTVEYGDDDLVFHAAMSDLLDGKQLKPEDLRVSSVCLANNTETPLSFKVKATLPFLFVDLDPACTKDGSPRANETEVRRLLPRSELRLHVAFRITRDLQTTYAPPQSKTFPLNPLIPVEKSIPKVADSASSTTKSEDAPSTDLLPKHCSTTLCDCPEGDGEAEPGTHPTSEEMLEDDSLKGTEPVDMIHFEDEMEIHYDNMSVQRLPLRATLAVPQLQLSHQTIDFGTCFIGQTRIKQIRLRNRTSSGSLWRVSLESQIEGCHPEIFTMDPAEGFLPAHLTHVTDSEQTINVLFKPTFSQVYHAKFVFSGMLGEEMQYIHIRGAGSYDGKHEAVLNI